MFAKPEQVNVSVEYLNISFLVKKPSGGSRLVTSFGEVAHYSKPQPSLMPNVDSVLRDIDKWIYLIVSDLLQSFYQIALIRSSMNYCGVATPYKGIRVYTRSAMGRPGSETCLEELMSRVKIRVKYKYVRSRSQKVNSDTSSSEVVNLRMGL